MPAARGGLAIRTADQPQPQLFNVYVSNKQALQTCAECGSLLAVRERLKGFYYCGPLALQLLTPFSSPRRSDSTCLHGTVNGPQAVAVENPSSDVG